MPDYKRLVSYIYNYEDGMKKNNVGYARVEARNGQCKCTLHIAAPSLNDKQLQVYIFKRRKEGLEGVLLGNFQVKNGTGDYKTVTDSQHIMNSAYGLDDMGGIVLYLSERKFFATSWDDAPITSKMVTGIDSRTFDRDLQAATVTAERQAPVVFYDEKTEDTVPDNIIQLIFKNTDRHSDRTKPDNIIELDDHSDQKEGEVFNDRNEDQLKNDKADKSDKALAKVVNKAKSSNAEGGTGEEKNSPEKNPDGNKAYIENTEKISKNLSAPKEALREDLFRIDTAKEKGNNSPKQKITAGKEKPDEKGDRTERVKGKIKVPGEEPLGAEVKPDTPEGGSQALKEPEILSGPGTVKEPGILSGPGSIEEPEILKGPEMVEEPEALEDAFQYYDYITREDGVFDNDRTPEGNPENFYEQFNLEDDREKIPEANFITENPEFQAEGNIENSTGEKQPFFEDHPLAKKIYRTYPRMYPFEDNEIAWCVRIEPQDIGLFPMEAWILGNNSFLLHGFYSYRHLIFARINDKNGFNYILGVPGIYHNREKFMAKMFGFEDFKCAKRKAQRTGEFGYWYIPITLN